MVVVTPSPRRVAAGVKYPLTSPPVSAYDRGMTTTPTDSPVYKVLGTTDDVTECGICGKIELKGTMVLDLDGEIIYAGFTCGARLAGKPVRELRTAAARADRARVQAAHDAWRAWSHARHTFEMDLGNRVLARLGLVRNFINNKIMYVDAEFVDGMAAYDAEHPRPADPTRR